MPAITAAPVTYAEFCEIRQRVTKRTFKEVHSSEDTSSVASFESPKVNGFIVKALTACSRKKVEECDGLFLFSQDTIVSGLDEPIMGEVLIFDAQTGVEVYSSVIYRTPKFVEDFLKKVWLVWLRVRRPPFCPECKNIRMKIYQRRVNGKTWWGCRRDARHIKKGPIWRQWDIMLTGEEQAIAREMRADRAAIREAIAQKA